MSLSPKTQNRLANLILWGSFGYFGTALLGEGHRVWAGMLYGSCLTHMFLTFRDWTLTRR